MNQYTKPETNGDDCRESGVGETSRQQFESWIRSKGLELGNSLLRVGPRKEMYCQIRIQERWEAWQASRSAIEITPPKFIDSREALSKGFMVDYSNGYGDAMDAYEERLKEAGITVKEDA